MSELIEGFPGGAVEADLAGGAASLCVDADVYPLDAVYAAAYVFIDRCYVLIDRPDPARFRVTLSPRQPGAGADALRELAGELANELLSCAWRRQIAVANRAAIEATTMQAMAGAMGPPSLEELAEFDFTDEAFDDPLGIAVSWEEKYARDRKKAEK